MLLDSSSSENKINLKISYRGADCKPDEKLVGMLKDELGLSSITSRILVQRGLSSAEDVKQFLNPTLRYGLPNPKDMLNIGAAADMILSSCRNKEPITIFCDFDVDGLTSGSQLYLFLKSLGANVNYYVPNRFLEGYGVSVSAIEKIALSGTKLLVTVDCGISSIKEITVAKHRGMKTVVVDHHEVLELPPADVIVDPEQEGCPFKPHKLAAAGLVWMLLIVLRAKAEELGASNLPDPKDFLDLAALGTICDMVPLRGVNRVLAHRGVEALRATKRPGLIALKEVAGVQNNPRFGAGHVGFMLGPRINAAGRLRDASEAFELLITGQTSTAKTLARAISRLNDDRRATEEQIVLECVRQIEEQGGCSESALTLFDEQFHLGVIGIVAQRLVDRYAVPAAVMAPGEVSIGGKIERVIKGSVRSVPGFHVALALAELKELCINCGGHEQAGGFSVKEDNFVEFCRAFKAVAARMLGQGIRTKTIVCDADVGLGEVDFQLVDELQKLAPFGVGNPAPILATHRVWIDSVQALSGGNFRLRFSDGRYFASAVAWGYEGHPLIKVGNKVSVVYSPEINTYQGVASVQLNVKGLLDAQ